MQQLKIWLMLLISLIIIAWGKNGGYAQINVAIPNIKTELGSTVVVPVLVSDLTGYGIIAYQFQVIFDSIIIKAKGVSVENTLTAQWGTVAANTDSAGIMMVGAFGVAELAGGDTLLKLIFEVIAKTECLTLITLKNFRFNNNNPQVSVVNGSLNIVFPQGIYDRSPAVMPQKMQLLYNYPEPFQDRTLIVFNIAKAGQIDIQIYNMLGQVIKNFGTNFSKTGRIVLDWNAKDNQGLSIPPGVYFCVVKQSNRIIAVDRMILLK